MGSSDLHVISDANPWQHCCPIISAKFAWRKNARHIKGLMSLDECNGSITFIKALLQGPGFSFL